MPEQTPAAGEPTAEQSPPVDPTPADDVEQPEAGDREAARYRRRLREVEADHATLARRLDLLQRAEVERLAAGTLTKPEDLWLIRPELADLLDDDGNVDAARVEEAVAAVVAERPSWRVQKVVDFDGGARTPAPAPASWSDVLGSGRR